MTRGGEDEGTPARGGRGKNGGENRGESVQSRRHWVGGRGEGEGEEGKRRGDEIGRRVWRWMDTQRTKEGIAKEK